MSTIKRTLWVTLLLIAICIAPVAATHAQNNVNLRILWFSDATEHVVLADLIQQFEADNPGITVEIDQATLGDLNARLLQEVQSGNPPDLARTNLPGSYKDYLLDLRPFLSDPEAWEANFNDQFLASLRDDPTDGGLHGFPTDISVSGPFINRTLWEEAGVPIPSDASDEVTWDEWVTAATQVQAALDSDQHKIFALAIDQSGHRFWGPSLSLCATYVDPEDPNGPITIDTEGFRAAATMLKEWHQENLVPLEVWTGDSDTLVPATEFFIDNQVAFYFSGPWQLSRFNSEIGESFEWETVPNPVGPCGQTGMIGGSTLIALDGTGHDEEIGKLVEYLTQYDVLEAFYSRNNLLPGQTTMIEQGITYSDPELSAQLAEFQAEIARANAEAFILQYRPDTSKIHGSIRRGLVDMLREDLTMNQTIDRINEYLNETP